MSLIIASGVAVEFGATTIFEDVGLTVSPGDRWGIIGRNGTGKTTFFNMVAGKIQPSRGSLSRTSGLRLTLLDQHREFAADTTVWEAAASPFAELLRLEISLAEQAIAMAEGASSEETLARYDRDLERFQREGGYEMEARVDKVLSGLGFDPVAARAQPVAQLSGGETGRVGLARQLVAPSDVLLLDEPTNHLDLETTRWLEAYLADLDATVLLISHDRAFLEETTDHILHFEAGTAFAYTGSYSDFVTQRDERRLQQERSFVQQQKKIAKEEDFIRRNIAGQKTAQAKGRRKQLARLPRLSPPPGQEGVMSVHLEPYRRGGNQVLVADDVALRIGDRVLVEGFSSVVRRGDVVGLVGSNGTGKSTLMDAITGSRTVDAGTLRTGESIDVAYYRQDMEQVPMGTSLFDVINDLRPTWDRGQVQGHLGRFGFSGASVQRTADTLSGGERARMALAILMLSKANFILLDEPTNHLDVESVEALEDALDGFEGTVLLVSHDRALLRNLVTRVWALADQRIHDYAGPFVEWEQDDADARAEAARQRAEAQQAEKEQARRDARHRQSDAGPERKRVRDLRRAAEEAEARVHRLEADVDDLTDRLADPAMYQDPARIDEAVVLKKELADRKAELDEAMRSWMEADEAASQAAEA